MKNLSGGFALALLLVATAPATPQAKMGTQEKAKQVAEILADSTMARLIFERIVADEVLRTNMLEQLATFGRSHPGQMAAMQQVFADAGDPSVAAKEAQEVLIKFKPGAEAGQINSMATELGLKEIKIVPQLGVRVYQITSGKKVQEVIDHCKTHAFVEYVEPNQTYKIEKYDQL